MADAAAGGNLAPLAAARGDGNSFPPFAFGSGLGWLEGSAAEAKEAGLGEFVLKNDEGEIIALNYDRMWVALVPVVRALRDRLDRLEARLAVD